MVVVASTMSSLTLPRQQESSIDLPPPTSIGTDISSSSSRSSSTGDAVDPTASMVVDHPSSLVTGRQQQPPQQQYEEDNESLDSPSIEGDDDDHHDDPSLWIDIDPMSDSHNSSSSNTNTSGTGSRWRRRTEVTAGGADGNNNNNNPIIKLQIPSLLCDFVTFFWDWTYAAVEVWLEVLSAPPFPLETLQKVSIVLLGVERIRDNIDQSTLIVFVNNPIDGTPIGGGGSGDAAAAAAAAAAAGGGADIAAAGGAGYYFTLASIPHYLIWGIPGLIALLSISFVLTLQLSWGHQEEAVIATALILLIFLEALLPLFILGCTSMFLFQQLSWETGLVLLIIVWLGSTFCAHCIRRMLYQSLGHG